MKTKIIFILSIFALSTSISHAAKMDSSAPSSSVSSSSGNSGEGGHRFGLGVSTVNVGTAGAQTMMTGWIPLNSKMGIQPYLGIFGTTGSFNFLAGGAFKATIAGGYSTGLHIGGDVLLGSFSSTFVGNFGGLVGFHYAFHPQIFLHVDAGPQVAVAGGTANFTLGGVSSLLGASLIYLF